MQHPDPLTLDGGGPSTARPVRVFVASVAILSARRAVFADRGSCAGSAAISIRFRPSNLAMAGIGHLRDDGAAEVSGSRGAVDPHFRPL